MGFTYECGRRVPDSPSDRANAQAVANELNAAREGALSDWGRRASFVAYGFFAVLTAASWITWPVRKQADTPCGSLCEHQLWALGISTTAVCVVTVIIGAVFVGHKRGNVFGLVVGKHNQFSTSLVQVGLWTLIVAFAFTMFVVQIAQGGLDADDSGFNSFNKTYLLLLGGPFAAAVLAKATAVAKSNAQTTQQTDAVTPQVKDLGTDPTGNTSLGDVQFLMFNLVAMAYFGVQFAIDPTRLPEIHSTLVGLTSVSALAYVGGKVVNSNPPAISSVSVIRGMLGGKATAGAQLRIIGKNFEPTGTSEDSDLAPAVLFDDFEVTDLELVTDVEIRVTVPDNLPPGFTPISVRTSKGVVSAAWTELEFT